MPLEPAQQLAHRPVVGDRIRHRDDGLEVEHAVAVGLEHGAAVGSGALRVLHVVEALGVRLPHVDGDVRDGAAPGVLDGAQDEQRLAVGVARDLPAGRQVVRLERVEGPEDRALGRAGRLGVVDAVDQQRQAQDVGQEDELVAHVAADLAHVDEEGDGGLPLGHAEARLARKVVQVRHQRLEEELEPRVLAPRVDAVHVLGDVVDRQVLERREIRARVFRSHFQGSFIVSVLEVDSKRFHKISTSEIGDEECMRSPQKCEIRVLSIILIILYRRSHTTIIQLPISEL